MNNRKTTPNERILNKEADMANEEQLGILKQGVEVWNRWREDNPDVIPDLSDADLSLKHLRSVNFDTAILRNTHLMRADLTGAILAEADLTGANMNLADLSESSLWGANLSNVNLIGSDLNSTNMQEVNLNHSKLREANLSWADLRGADLSHSSLIGANLSNVDMRNAVLNHTRIRNANLIGADLRESQLFDADLQDANLTVSILFKANMYKAKLSKAKLYEADLREVDLREADLREADLTGANLNAANLSHATLVGCNLTRSQLIQTNLASANIWGCRVFGVSAWKVNLSDALQGDLIITDQGESIITVDNMEIAQFIYLLLNNEKLRDVIDTVGKKAVLILGRFMPERKVILDALRKELRVQGYLPIMFDFEKPANRDLTETISILAHLSRFIIADITDAKSIPQELQAIVPNLPSVAVQPLIQASEYEYAMFDHFMRYSWVLPLYKYSSHNQLISNFKEDIIRVVERKVQELRNI